MGANNAFHFQQKLDNLLSKCNSLYWCNIRVSEELPLIDKISVKITGNDGFVYDFQGEICGDYDKTVIIIPTLKKLSYSDIIRRKGNYEGIQHAYVGPALTFSLTESDDRKFSFQIYFPCTESIDSIRLEKVLQVVFDNNEKYVETKLPSIKDEKDIPLQFISVEGRLDELVVERFYRDKVVFTDEEWRVCGKVNPSDIKLEDSTKGKWISKESALKMSKELYKKIETLINAPTKVISYSEANSYRDFNLAEIDDILLIIVAKNSQQYKQPEISIGYDLFLFKRSPDFASLNMYNRTLNISGKAPYTNCNSLSFFNFITRDQIFLRSQERTTINNTELYYNLIEIIRNIE